MAEEAKKLDVISPTNEGTPTADVVKETESAGTKDTEHMIPISRFNELNERMKKAEAKTKKLDAKIAADEKKALEEQGKWKELYDGEVTKSTSLQEAAVQNRKKEAVLVSIFATGCQTPKHVLKLIDFSKIEINDETDTINGIEEQITTLQKEIPALFDIGEGKPAPNTDGSYPGKVKAGRMTLLEAQEFFRGKPAEYKAYSDKYFKEKYGSG